MTSLSRYALRLDPVLKARLEKAARRNKRSLNAEITSRLSTRGWRRELRRQLLGLAPAPDDPRTDEEIAAEIEWLHPGGQWRTYASA